MVYESTNTLIKHLINELRNISIDALRFKEYVSLAAQLLLAEAAQRLETQERKIPTWIGEQTFRFINEQDIVVVAILRAALPMQEGILRMFPAAKGGFLAMKRDEKSFKPILYYKRLPNIENKTVIVVDPMLATGGSLCDALSLLKQEAPSKIISLNLIAAPEGVYKVEKEHPDIDLFIAQIDQRLNKEKFIIPGLGDAGDRAYNTEEK